MSSIVIASKNDEEAEKIKESIKENLDVVIITTEEEIKQHLKSTKLFLLDHTFNEQIDSPLLIGILKKAPFPVLFLTNPNDGDYTVRAMQHGASNFVVKVGDYYPLLKLTIQRLIDEFNAKSSMVQQIAELQKQIEERDTLLQERSENIAIREPQERDSGNGEGTILEEIVFVFKRGEIELPSPPKVAVKFKELINKGADIQEIADLLGKDMALSSKLISISNSAYYRGVTENKNLDQAINRLGIKVTQQYTDVIANRSLYATRNKRFRGFMENLWAHSLSCAYASQITADSLELNLPGDAFTLGLIHDIGKLVLYQVVSELQMKKKIGENVGDSEILETVEMNHATFGASLLKLWNFSSGYVNVAAYHDNLDPADHPTKELMVVNFTNQLVKTMGYGQNEPSTTDIETLESYKQLEFNAKVVDGIKVEVKELMDEFKDFFN